MASNSDDQAAKRRARQRRLERDDASATARGWGKAPIIGYAGGTGYGAMGDWAPRIRDIDDAPVMDPPGARR